MILLVIRNEEEARQMFAWASRFAEGSASALKVIVGLKGRETLALNTEACPESWVARLQETLPDWAELSWFRAPVRQSVIDHYLAENEIELLIVGKHFEGNQEDPDIVLSRGLFDSAQCAVLIMRIGTRQKKTGKILVPCSGGRHSRRALRLVHSFAPDAITTLLVTANADSFSEQVGDKLLKRAIEKAEIDPSSVRRKVVLNDQVLEGIRREVEEGDYGLVVLGAGAEGKVRRKLFGIVPAKQVKGERGTAVSVLRAPRPVGHRVREWLAHRVALTIPQLSRDDRISLMAEIEGKARWSFDFAALMVLATMIASLGLLANSVAVVIGAMLVAPLMMPLIGGGLALVQGNWPLWTQSLKAVVLGFFAALVVGGSLGLTARLSGFPMTSELLARGRPTLLDLGIAFVSGVAASYCLARPKLSGALAGVAIAAALVPPIATVGISAGLGDLDNATGSALLFGTNVVAVILGSAINFALAGIRGRGQGGEWQRRVFIFLTLASIACAVPLTLYLLEGLKN